MPLRPWFGCGESCATGAASLAVWGCREAVGSVPVLGEVEQRCGSSQLEDCGCPRSTFCCVTTRSGRLNEVGKKMLLSQLTSRLLKASRVAGHFLPRSVSSFLCCHSTSVNYCTQPPNKNGAQPQRWHVLEPELEEMLVPRKLSISPLESWLTVRYSLPKAEVSIAQEEVGSGPVQRYDCPPSDEGADVEEGEGTPNNTLQCKNVLKIRRRKMNRHKFKKLLKRRKFVRRRIKEGRKKKRQVRSA